MNSSIYCPNLWHGLHVSTEGDIKPCCFWPNISGHNLKSSKIEEVVNSEEWLDARRKMICGQKPELCRPCFDQEARGQYSTRYWNIKACQSQSRKMEKPLLLRKLDPYFVDLRFDNTCNLRCKTCCGDASTAWAAFEHKTYPTNTLEQKQILKDTILGSADNLVEIYFAGGEPILMKEAWQLVEQLLEQGTTHLKLRYNTNLTTLEAWGKNILDLWEKWIAAGGEVQVAVSVDATGEAEEYIRQGTNWQKQVQNFKDLTDRFINSPKMYISVVPVISILNVCRVPELFKFVESLGLDSHIVETHNILVVPRRYCLQILPDTYKKTILNVIDGSSLREQEYKRAIEVSLNQKHYTEQECLDEIQQFIELEDLDRFNQINPELKDWWKYGRTI